jgi:hypothetical protein
MRGWGVKGGVAWKCSLIRKGKVAILIDGGGCRSVLPTCEGHQGKASGRNFRTDAPSSPSPGLKVCPSLHSSGRIDADLRIKGHQWTKHSRDCTAQASRECTTDTPNRGASSSWRPPVHCSGCNSIPDIYSQQTPPLTVTAKNSSASQVRWLKPIIPATWEEEIRRV